MATTIPGAASGAGAILGLAREQCWGGGPGANTVNYFRANLPLNLEFVRPELPSGQVNAARREEAGLPGPVTLAPDFGFSMVPAHVLELMENIHGAATKANPVGVYTYAFDYDPTAVRPSLYAVSALPPTNQRSRRFGGMLSQLTLAMGGNAPIFARFAGLFQHGTSIGPAEADAGNTGSYAGPEIRGVIADPTLGDIYVSATRDVAGGGVQFKLEQIASSPTYPGAAIDVVYDADGDGKYQLVYEDTGSALVDLGLHGENYDPVEIIWPGTSAGTHSDIDIGDFWVFKMQESWADPTPSFISPTGPRLTANSFFVDYRAVGGGTWIELPLTTAQIVMGTPLSAEQGVGSKYPRYIDQEGAYFATIQLARRLRDEVFTRRYEAHEAVELRLRWEGQRIGTDGSLREGMVSVAANATIESLTHPVADENAVVETVNLRCRTNDAGDSPLATTVTTSRDYTVTS